MFLFKKSLKNYAAPLRIVLFLLGLLLVWLPVAIPIYLILNSSNPNLTSTLTLVLLYLEFIFLLRYWSKQVHQNSEGLKLYGLVRSRPTAIELLNGLSIGLLFTLSLFVIEAVLGWVKFQEPSVNFWRIVIEGLLVGLGIGFAEELLFRGWILDELQRDYKPSIALWSNAILFASLHFIKPLAEIIRTLPQFPALVILGLTLVWAKWSCSGRMGLNIGLHWGLVWGYYILKVGKLIVYTGTVSPGFTGIDGNPIAGIMGLGFLSLLAGIMRGKANIKRFKAPTP
ncbi:CPBP family intramembrane glutamic endopeptidase [Gloeothece verrucosa]|uniref:Abortive infection protein n=1 Tax=Gloeothece verrucosa (strain PCC 7822) TaxID=497965 RepID=E0UE02_GLOV7|nr:CPBP family intramembrane glutamic endopeptidase [Gloeothece verrucosa]ADN13006.1 Abortive infection protein [Gloeothece verrucosa PCC 7822]